MLEAFAFFRNELKFTLRQGGLLYLLFLYPLFVITVVGFAFNTPPSITVPMGIYSADPRFADAVAGYKGFEAHIAPTPYEAEMLVRKGVVPASIIVTRCDFYSRLDREAGSWERGGNSCDGSLFITFVQDPSRTSEVSFLKILFEAALRDKLSLSAKEITAFQSQAMKIRDEIPAAKNEIVSIRQKLQEEKTELQNIHDSINLGEIQASLNGLDEVLQFFGSAQSQSSQSIADLQNYQSDISGQRDQLDRDFTQFHNDLNSLQNQVQTARSKRDYYVTRLDYYISRLDSASSQLSSAYSALSSAYSSSPSPALATAMNYVSNARNEVTSANNELRNAKTDMQNIDFNSMLNQINSARNYLTSTQSRVGANANSAQSRISQAISSLSDFSNNAQRVQSTLSSGRNRLATVYDSAKNAKSRALQLGTEIDEIISKSYSAESKLDNTRDVVRQFISLSPSDFTPPQLTDKNVVEASSKLLFNFPFLLMINVALFAVLFPVVITSKMQENGVEDRLRQKGAAFSYTVGRFAGDYLVVLFQTALFFLFAFIIFQVVPISFSNLLQAATIMLVILPFTALGFLLSRIIRKVATGLLVSLLLFIPMVFLSGKLLPFIFMDVIMRLLASVQLFTVSLNLLELSFFRCEYGGCDPFSFLAGSAYLLFATGCFLLLSLFLWYLKTSADRTKWKQAV